MLSDRNIKVALRTGSLYIHPLNMNDVQPASVDLHLAADYRRWSSSQGIIDVADIPEDYTFPQIAVDDGILVNPGEIILGSTIEHVRIGGQHCARVEGRSSLGRIGVLTHLTAGFIDPGFVGNITLEILNESKYSILLRPGMRIAQICFFRLDATSIRAYGHDGLGTYVGVRADGPVPARGDIR